MSVSPRELVDRLRQEYFGDNRSTYADIQAVLRSGSVGISGTVIDRPAAEFLLGILSQHDPSINWRDEMTTLVSGPDYSWALPTRSVIDVREEPSNRTPRVTQIIFGDPVEILRRSGHWAYVRSYDSYLGWTQADSLQPCSLDTARDWTAGITHIVNLPLLACYADASGEPHQQVMLLPFGARIHVEGTDGPYRRIRCPDGVLRWVPATGLLPVADIWNTGIEGLRTILGWAQTLIGVPYLWGGKTPFGYDCSGLVQTLFRMVGINLKRDANQQFEEGRHVDFGEIRFGDLLFFDTNTSDDVWPIPHEHRVVSHVAFALNEQDFLHASRSYGGVVRGSFDPMSPFHAPILHARFLGGKRYIV